VIDIQGEVSSKFTKNSKENLSSEKKRVVQTTTLEEKVIGKYIEIIYIRISDERNYLRWNSFSEENETDKKFKIQIKQFNQILGLRVMLFNLSFDVIGFCKRQGNIDIDDFKLETKQKYPIIYVNEHPQINRI
jgi:hypothetical protein